MDKLEEEDGFVIALFGFLLLPISFIADIIMGNNYLSFGLFSVSFIFVCVGIIIMFTSLVRTMNNKINEQQNKPKGKVRKL